ncbi:SGNH/GDSL hydrolase family protein [Enterococcus sp. LJL98]
MEKTLKTTIVFMGMLLISFLFFSWLIPKAPQRLTVEEPSAKAMKVKEKIHLVAIGDSLTEGIGDETKRGGYVPLIAENLEESFDLGNSEIENYGVAGDRSTQILKRVKEQEEIQTNLASAKIITLTVGGNDLMKVIQNNILGLSPKKFEKPAKKYQEHLVELLAEIRKYNPTAPVYVLGIYNPYYIYFPEITEMQTIVDDWNDHTQEIVEDQANMYFIPVNDLIYQGIFDAEDTTGMTDIEAVDTLNDLRNNAIYEGDNFHPNYNGYQLIAQAFSEKIKATKNEWLGKE